MRFASIALLVSLVACGGESPPADLEDLPVPPIHTPRWAFSPWISKDISSTDDTYDFVRGFRERDIPVGVVVIDSPWETNYNTFVPSERRYPSFARLVGDLRADGVRVVLWITPMINEGSFDLEPGTEPYEGPSPNYEPALKLGYFINSGKQYFWWKGSGGALDFYNTEAIRWWHRQQDPLFDLGVSGFKLDFGDSYVQSATVSTAKGIIPHQEYSESYYRDFYSYGVHKAGPEEFVTMVRGYDESYQFEGRFYARKEHAPVVWMGDNRRDYLGLEDALDHMFRSARAGYVVVGSDIGGYLDKDDRDLLGPVIPFDSVVFARWTAVAALTPFMQLHGRANIAPWTVADRADDVVSMYRYWATLHEELVPFFYALAEEAYAGASEPIVRPIGDEAAWAHDYRFLAGDAFLVAPLLDASGVRTVELPAGGRWFDWWSERDAPLEGGTTVTASIGGDLGRIPLYVREGAIVPANVRSTITGLGSAASADRTTIALWPAPAGTTRFTLHERDGEGELVVTAEDAHSVRIDLPPSRPLVLRVRSELALSSASLDGASLPAHPSREDFERSESGSFEDAGQKRIWLRIEASDAARVLRLSE